MKRYAVTVRVAEANFEQTVTVTAADEWKARTAAMFEITFPLRGETVEYIVREAR